MSRKTILLAVFTAILSVGPSQAQVVRLQSDFAFNGVTVPSGDSGNRIIVQINPNAPRIEPVMAEPDTPETPQTIALPALTGLEWFWMAVSPALADGGPGRLALALAEIDKAPEGKAVPEPRLQHLYDIAAKHGLDILRHTVGTDV